MKVNIFNQKKESRHFYSSTPRPSSPPGCYHQTPETEITFLKNLSSPSRMEEGGRKLCSALDFFQNFLLQVKLMHIALVNIFGLWLLLTREPLLLYCFFLKFLNRSVSLHVVSTLLFICCSFRRQLVLPPSFHYLCLELK